jgi:L-lactate dehydrogenase complex protein LldG
MTARTEILDRVRAAQRTGRIPTVSAAPLPAPVAADADGRLARFRAELELLGVACAVEATESGVQARVAALIAGHAVLAWDPEHLPYGVGGLAAGATRGRDARERQAVAEVGLTGCDAAIAETGSLVLLSGPGKARMVSLLPPLHVAVVERRVLCATMAELFARHASSMAAVACTTVITGPSRTADIELSLTLGVHGPGKVVVVVGP